MWLTALVALAWGARGPADGCAAVQPQGVWSTKKDAAGVWQFYNSAKPGPQVLRGISMTGFETGTRRTGSGAGYWLFMAQQPGANYSAEIIRNIVRTLVNEWGVKLIRMPICGSGWLQDYPVKGYGGIPDPYHYKDWVDIAVCEAVSLGAVVILDLHLWAIGKETNLTRNTGIEDGCTGINRVEGTDSCAPHDWYGQYTSLRTGKTYNKGDAQDEWECSIANADGCTLHNILRPGNDGVTGVEHFVNVWYELALRYRNTSNVWFELMNEPYVRKSAEFGVQCDHGVCPPGIGFGDNLDETEYPWQEWSHVMDAAIKTIRDDAKASNIIILSSLDWSYDWLGKGGGTGGPLARPSLLPWVNRNVANIAYAMHPYQHGSCCGEIGADTDLSINDPYQAAYCQYPPVDQRGFPIASKSPVPIPNTHCDSTGYATTQNKKAPPCHWVANAVEPPTPPTPAPTPVGPPTPPTPPPTVLPGCNIMEHQNVRGHDIVDGGTNKQPDVWACCDSCQRNQDCIGFTYVPNSGGECWLKDKLDDPSPDGSVISGRVSEHRSRSPTKSPHTGPSASPTRAPTPRPPGVCAGDRDYCEQLDEQQCKAISWNSTKAGGWSTYVLPMKKYGPVIATEHGSFDCSSPFERTLTHWMRLFNVSYTAWALWPQNSGGPGQGACGYPSVMMPTDNVSDGFGKGKNNCVTLAGCKQLLKPLGWSGQVVFRDINTP